MWFCNIIAVNFNLICIIGHQQSNTKILINGATQNVVPYSAVSGLCSIMWSQSLDTGTTTEQQSWFICSNFGPYKSSECCIWSKCAVGFSWYNCTNHKVNSYAINDSPNWPCYCNVHCSIWLRIPTTRIWEGHFTVPRTMFSLKYFSILYYIQILCR